MVRGFGVVDTDLISPIGEHWAYVALTYQAQLQQLDVALDAHNLGKFLYFV